MTLRALMLIVSLTLGPGPALADTYNGAEVTYDRYEISGASLSEVQDQMSAKGPQGFWAYTTWRVDWTGGCDITVTAAITLPELSADAALNDLERAEFDRMLDALAAHELGHVDFGLGAARDIAAAGCPANSNALFDPWLAQERAYDANTNHGLTQGVYLEAP